MVRRARHVFYDCGGGQYIAFWDLHDDSITEYETDISKSVGLPQWVNHLAWDGGDEATYQAHLERWRSCGITVAEVDHGFCKSIYTVDPNGVMVEFCLMTKELAADDAAEAELLLAADRPELEASPAVVIHEPLASVTR